MISTGLGGVINRVFGTATAAGRKTGIMNAGSRDEDDGDESQVDRDYPIKPLEKTPHSDFVAGAPDRLQGVQYAALPL